MYREKKAEKNRQVKQDKKASELFLIYGFICLFQ